MNTFKLPDVGEGLTEAEIVSWKVAEGDTVAINDPLVEIETAKSLVELPSPYAGVVTKIMVAEGVTVDVGTAIIAIASEGAEVGEASADATPAETADASEAAEAKVEHLVGTGPRADAAVRRARRRPQQGTGEQAPKQQHPAQQQQSVQQPGQPTPVAAPSVHKQSRALASPIIRKAAKDAGIDLNDIPATGASGQVSRDDLNAYLAAGGRVAASSAAARQSPVRAQGSDERVAVRGVRKVTAQAMVNSAFTAPHVSIFLDVDATRTMEFVGRLKKSRDFEGIRVSPLLVVARAVIWAAQRNPATNASWVSNSSGDDEIVYKSDVNLGIAAATPRGLLVPNIKAAQELSLRDLALALSELSSKAREGRTSPQDMAGGSLTITNIGALGLDTGTPILNPGEVSILAFGTIKQKPWVVDGVVVPRWVTTLGGSFDHRVVDGDLAARFLTDVASILEEPALLLD